MCKYHIVFTPKYRRKIIYNQYRESLREIIKLLCKYRGMEIIEGHLMPDSFEHTAKNECIEFYGVFKGQERVNDVRKICEPEI